MQKIKLVSIFTAVLLGMAFLTGQVFVSTAKADVFQATDAVAPGQASIKVGRPGCEGQGGCYYFSIDFDRASYGSGEKIKIYAWMSRNSGAWGDYSGDIGGRAYITFDSSSEQNLVHDFVGYYPTQKDIDLALVKGAGYGTGAWVGGANCLTYGTYNTKEHLFYNSTDKILVAPSSLGEHVAYFHVSGLRRGVCTTGCVDRYWSPTANCDSSLRDEGVVKIKFNVGTPENATCGTMDGYNFLSKDYYFGKSGKDFCGDGNGTKTFLTTFYVTTDDPDDGTINTNFPPVGSTTEWICDGLNGGTQSKVCTATRLNVVPVYSCTGGNPPNGANWCSSDDTGLSADTPWSESTACTDKKKCEYVMPTLTASLTANPATINTGVKTDLTAAVTGGTATGDIEYLNQDCGSNSNGDKGNISAETTTGTFKCDYSKPGTYTATADVKKQITVSTSATITVTEPVAKINGACGGVFDNINNKYVITLESDTPNWNNNPQCVTGTASSTTLPAKGSATTWTCAGTGISATNCTAKRKPDCSAIFAKDGVATSIPSVTVGQVGVGVFVLGSNNVTLNSLAEYTCSGPLTTNNIKIPFSLTLEDYTDLGGPFYYQGSILFSPFTSSIPNIESCTVTVTGANGLSNTCTTPNLTVNPAAITCGTANGQSLTSAPTTNLCSDASAPTVTGAPNIGQTWDWDCSPTAHCTATKICIPSGTPALIDTTPCDGACNGGSGFIKKTYKDSCDALSVDNIACTNPDQCPATPMKWKEL